MDNLEEKNETETVTTEINESAQESVQETTPTDAVAPKLGDIEQKVADYIGACVSQFTAEMKRKVNALGYEIELKVDVLFGKPD
jgi:hypothetical protein